MVANFIRSLSKNKQKQIPQEDLPNVTVILCVRGPDPYLAECLTGLLDQDYLNYNVTIVLDHAKDPARGTIEQVLNSAQTANISLSYIDKKYTTCSLRCSCTLHAISTLDPSTQVVALLDADTIPHKTWLRELVSPLADKKIGATTGFRWYHPKAPAWGAIVRYLWNAAAVVQMHQHQIPWGGSLAFRTSLLKDSDLLDRWRLALVDDTSLYNVIQSRGLRLEYVPTLVMINHEVCTLKEFFLWVKRQLLATRLYHPGWRTICSQGFIMAILSTAAFGALVLAISHGSLVSTLWLGAGLIIQQTGLLLLRIPLHLQVSKMAAENGKAMARSNPDRFIRVFLSTLLLQIIYPSALMAVLCVRRIRWRQIEYSIEGPWKIRMNAYRRYNADELNPEVPSSL